MRERSLYRIGAVSAIVGSILAGAVNLLHPRTPHIDRVEAFLPLVAGSAAWVGIHVGILFAVLLWTGALLAVWRSLGTEPGAAWAELGLAGALVSAAIGLVWMAADGIAMKVVADAWASAAAAEKAVAFRDGFVLAKVNIAIFTVWDICFFGVTFILYGLAVATSGAYPKWLGWVAMLAGIGSALVGLNLAYQGPSHLVLNILFPIFSIILTVWVFVMGVLLWRRAGAA